MSDDKWIMHGLAWDDPYRVRTSDELINYINEVGFLPLFRNEVEGFSVEEHVSPNFWWSGDIEQDPWEWRVVLSESGKVAYGKFFNGKSGYVSLQWFPAFANYRRDGYDFDARWDDGLANRRSKKIMDSFERFPEFESYNLKSYAGFGKGGEKNFSGIVTALQMQTYLVIHGFRFKTNKRGEPYGMPVSVYAMPETLWGYDTIAAGYKEEPEDSLKRITEHIRGQFPNASEADIRKLI